MDGKLNAFIISLNPGAVCLPENTRNSGHFVLNGHFQADGASHTCDVNTCDVNLRASASTYLNQTPPWQCG